MQFSRLSRMQTQNSKSNVTELKPVGSRNTSGADESLLTRISSYLKDKRALVNVCLNTKRLESVSKEEHSAIALVVKELEIWSKLLGKRDVDILQIRHPFLYLAPSDLTEFRHILASRFHLSESDARQHRAVSKIEDLSEDGLALLKGLGFNQFQICATQRGNDLEDCIAAIELIRKYDFPCVGIQITDADCLGEMRELITGITAKCHPDFIYLGSQTGLLDLTDCWKPEIYQYKADQHRNTAVLYDQDLSVQNNCLSIGPEGTSYLNDELLQNYCDHERYSNAVQADKLPVNTGIKGRLSKANR